MAFVCFWLLQGKKKVPQNFWFGWDPSPPLLEKTHIWARFLKCMASLSLQASLTRLVCLILYPTMTRHSLTRRGLSAANRSNSSMLLLMYKRKFTKKRNWKLITPHFLPQLHIDAWKMHFWNKKWHVISKSYFEIIIVVVLAFYSNKSVGRRKS